MTRPHKRRRALRGALAVAAGLAWIAPAASGVGVDPEADEILKEMAGYVSGLKALSVDVEIDNQVVDFDGQKLSLSTSGSIVLQRPQRLRVRRRGGIADLDLFFDGRHLVLHSGTRKLYASLERPGTIDDVIGTLRWELGVDAPAGDILSEDPLPGLLTGVVSGEYLGWGYVDGVRCHHLAFRAERTDWQLWVETGDTPRPLKYVITSKWVAGAPQYIVRFRNWSAAPKIDAASFAFKPPAGSRQVDSIPVNAAGQILVEEMQ